MILEERRKWYFSYSHRIVSVLLEHVSFFSFNLTLCIATQTKRHKRSALSFVNCIYILIQQWEFSSTQKMSHEQTKTQIAYSNSHLACE